jgi:hypothetical protein
MIFLRDTISHAAYRRVWRECFNSLQDLLFDEVLVKQTFTTLGAARLLSDVDAIQGTVESVSRGAGAALSMPRLKDGVTLLNLPILSENGRMSLKKACEDIFETNAQAYAALEELDITKLTLLQARKILQNRVEAVN